ncbi:MAG TPA: class I SAM-dependent methyltransferase, partial [Pyrinomonadaceae bacterium]|nr:class I SAM-dependent methyltransferase [Pyrinomonadaceae bacterium]
MKRLGSATNMENEIQQFWQQNPCGASLVGDMTDDERREYEEFFARYDAYRYEKEPHILKNLDAIDFQGKRILEIGLGQGADSEELIKRGAIYTGFDLTEESVKRVKMRFELRSLPYQTVEQGSAVSLPFDDNSFDMVFSHGVLHHIPEIKKASAEIARVLKPDGELVAMLYAKWSLNYLLSIFFVRRLALLGLYIIGAKRVGIVGEHLANAKAKG